MASNGYNGYNYQDYQQSAAQQYPAYQTAPAANVVAQNPRPHYQQTTPVPTTQTTDYMPSYAAPSYGNQANTYGGAQNNSWAGTTYGGNRETTSRAAEVLRNMSNTAYGQNATTYTSNTSAAVTQPGFTATNSATASSARYSNASPVPQVPQTQHTHPSHSYNQTQGQAQVQAQVQAQPQIRPPSVGAIRGQHPSTNRGRSSPAVSAGYPSQRVQYNQTPRRPESPAQPQYSHNTTAAVSSSGNVPMTTATQYPDHRHRQLPSVDVSRNTPTNTTPAPYNYSDGQTTAPVAQTAAPANVGEQYSQGTATVDPMAVYDPWREHQRKQEKLRQQKAVEDAAREEEERKAEERRREEERKAEEVRREEELRREELRREEERKEAEARQKAEEEERARQAALPKAKGKQPAKRVQKEKAVTVHAEAPVAESSKAAEDGSDKTEAEKLEEEIRAMMAKMRELNNKDPALLARIWEEERRAKAPKSPTTQPKPVPHPPSSSSTQPSAPQVAAPQPANQRKKITAKEPPNAANSAMPHAQKPMMSPASDGRPQAQTVVAGSARVSDRRPQAQAVVPGSARTSGNTVWPSEKKEQLASAAASYLNLHNPDHPVTKETILRMLDGSPSYIELCELLESMSLNLDRAAFAKNLLTAVPDVNSASRTQVQAQARTPGQMMNGPTTQRTQVPLAVTTKKDIPTGVGPSPQYAPAQSPLGGTSFPPFPGEVSASHSPAPVAEMIVIKPELKPPKPPANKEEAARKRTFNDLIDLTAASDDDLEPAPKRQDMGAMYSYNSPGTSFHDAMEMDQGVTPTNNFPVASSLPSHAPHHSPPPPPHIGARMKDIVQPLDKKKALRRSGYNIKTIARDVLLACGRHPEERPLNGHLEVLKVTLTPWVNVDADLSTLRWDLLDPGQPPKGYYRDGVQTVEEDADDETDSDDENGSGSGGRSRAPSQTIGGGVNVASAQALPPTNPFKHQKPRRGRPPRHSVPGTSSTQTPRSNSTQTPRANSVQTTRRHSTSTANNMSESASASAASAPRPSAASVGYTAFRSVTELGPDGKPLKKKGRPVGWRKAIHGSAAAQSRPGANRHTGPRASPNGYTPSRPSALKNVGAGDDAPIMVRSRSSSVANKAPRYQSFPCRWQNCKADLHNIETLRKHVHKVHRKQTLRGTLECLWGNCGTEITGANPVTGMRIERHSPFYFTEEAKWREHLELRHFTPLSWELGDGPASGLSDAHDTEAYLSDAQGRRVTPRVSADPSQLGSETPAGRDRTNLTNSSPAPRGRGRPPKVTQEQQARETQNRMVAQKKRMGGPGMDRGGSTFANEKRRRGFSDDDRMQEEFVDADL